MTLISDVVGIVDQVTQALALPVDVTVEACVNETASGDRSYAPPVTYQAVADRTTKPVMTEAGELTPVLAYLAILRPIPPNGAAGRVEPIDPRDRFTLPDGATGPVVKSAGFVDSGTGRPAFHEVWLGR